MKKVEYKTKAGKTGFKYVLEAGDKVEARFSSVRESKLGKFVNYTLGVNWTNPKTKAVEQIYVQLTKGQSAKLAESGDLAGKHIEAYGYQNEFGSQIGVKVV